MRAPGLIAAALATALAFAPGPRALAAGFTDVLDTPASMSALAAKSGLQAIARAGKHLVAVGQRGHIVVSSDSGATWKQSQVPVSSDLTAVYFVDERYGWAVGHDGVILHSRDGGLTWGLQLDGRGAADLLLAAMERRAAAEPASVEARKLLDEARRYKAQGADKPFFDVWFLDTQRGYAVGAYNFIFRTIDAGRTWEPWFDRTENPRFFNLYAIRPAGGEVFIAGEGGLVLKLDAAAQRFRKVGTPYDGSYFGVGGTATRVVVFGLRGNVYGSDDAGKTWDKVDAHLPASVVASARTPEGQLVLADASGRLAASIDGGRSFERLGVGSSVPVGGLAVLGEGRFALVGPRGVQVTRAAMR